MIIPERSAKALTDKVLALSKADSSVVTVSGRKRRHLRFALNSVTTNGEQDDLVLSVRSSFGNRSGSAQTNELNDEAIATAVKKSEEIAKFAPPDPEFMPPLGPQSYLPARTYFEATAQTGPDQMAAMCKPVLDLATKSQVTAAGFFNIGASSSAMATTNGLFAYQTATSALFTVSARTSDGTGAGWAGVNFQDISRLDPKLLGERAVAKTIDSRGPQPLQPGKYLVLLEPSAVCDLLAALVGRCDARSADEGRSFFTKKGGGNKRGEKIFGDKVNVYSDPHDEIAPGSIYSSDGLPSNRRNWIEDGVLKELIYSRFWAKKTNHEPVPFPTNIVMTGGSATREEMIQSVKRGILVTRFWYIRDVDPRTLLLTGLTRDGTFLIEDGKIIRPVKNFRFNESPVAMLNHIEAMGKSERAVGSESEDLPVSVPPLLVRDFTFSSLSDAV
jgi:predicted Zn-dependent protease